MADIMMTTSNLYCRLIVEILARQGVRTAFCSPGSRNAPLLIAIDSMECISKQVVVDERSAAFQALGFAMVSKSPVMLVCTSGTALLNYAPAVAEAYYSGIPLIIVSADRPREWIDQDDSQTIRQFGALAHIVKGSFDIRAIPEGTDSEFTSDVRWTVNRTVNEAYLKAMEGKKGPVHINVQLTDPLGTLGEEPPLQERLVSLISTSQTVSSKILKDLASLAADSRIMLVAGFLQPDHVLHDAVRRFASLPNVVIMAETLSNLHDPQPMSSMVDSVLCDMTDEEKRMMCPDIVISIGGALVSRMLKQYLRDYPPRRHWCVGHSNYFCDCFRIMSEKIEIEPAPFLRQLFGAIRKTRRTIESSYSAEWVGLRSRSAALAHSYIKNLPWSDLKALDYIFRNVEFDNLFLSNGTAVRYSQLLPHDCHAEYCNRGVSGIDGCTSTALGGSKAYKGETLLLSGDMSWLYDSGASTLSDIPNSMRMIVMDNDGGGIFRFVKATSAIPGEMLERYFCVSGLPDIEAIACAYGIECMTVNDYATLSDGVRWLMEDSDLPRLLLVVTPAGISSDVLSRYFIKNQNK